MQPLTQVRPARITKFIFLGGGFPAKRAPRDIFFELIHPFSFFFPHHFVFFAFPPFAPEVVSDKGSQNPLFLQSMLFVVAHACYHKHAGRFYIIDEYPNIILLLLCCWGGYWSIGGVCVCMVLAVCVGVRPKRLPEFKGRRLRALLQSRQRTPSFPDIRTADPFSPTIKQAPIFFARLTIISS